MMFAVVVAAMEEEVALQSLLQLQADCCHRIATTADCRNKKKREDLCNSFDDEGWMKSIVVQPGEIPG